MCLYLQLINVEKNVNDTQFIPCKNQAPTPYLPQGFGIHVRFQRGILAVSSSTLQPTIGRII